MKTIPISMNRVCSMKLTTIYNSMVHSFAKFVKLRLSITIEINIQNTFLHTHYDASRTMCTFSAAIEKHFTFHNIETLKIVTSKIC